ncbi:MAG: hypothetical protein UT11_C0020G0005 [Berkelbacteria bacterium GW2011_GWA2_38_9]|uniref:SpoVT-AbrB domain-containing protein n=1 Tax=Berkelbacteria bacterium GW2011_GWA2_38_9 TaxID=1618334 RepID=A0A0G0LF68_9BACT|nr:MAG: hypothetical protein UT11_C0020G0005 [Berkelbacteria bacterium GW2011_GWA2_38_9]
MITQKIYQNGKILIPDEIRKIYGFGSLIKIELKKDGIMIKPKSQETNSIKNTQKIGSLMLEKSRLSLQDLLGGNITDWELSDEKA